MGYHKRGANSAEWNEWSKAYNHGTDCLSFIISANGTVAAIDTKQFYDMQDIGGIGAPFGYIRTNELSTTMYHRIKRELNPILLEKLPSTISAMYNLFFDSFLVGYDGNNKKVSDDLQMDYLISQLYERDDYAWCSLLLFNTYKYIDDIVEPGLLANLAYYFGRLAFKDEFYNCLNKLSLLEYQWTGEAINNIGAALCDNFFIYEHAIECFTEAIRIKPELWQPKQSIFVAGKYQILELCDKDKANEAYQLGVKIQSLVGNYTTDDHGFYSYLDLQQK